MSMIMKELNSSTEYYKKLAETLQEKNLELLEEIRILEEKLEEKTMSEEERSDIKLSKDEIKFRDDPVLLSMKLPNDSGTYMMYKSFRGYHLKPNSNNQKEKYAYLNAKSKLVKRFGLITPTYENCWSDKTQGYYALAKELKDAYDIKEYLIVPSYYKNKIQGDYMLVSLNEFKADFPEITIDKIVNVFKDDIKIGYIDMIDWENRKFTEEIYKEYTTYDMDLNESSNYGKGPMLNTGLMLESCGNLFTKMKKIIMKREEN